MRELEMGNSNNKCGGIDNYKWLIALALQALVKVIMSFIEKNKESKRPKDSASLRETK